MCFVTTSFITCKPCPKVVFAAQSSNMCCETCLRCQGPCRRRMRGASAHPAVARAVEYQPGVCERRLRQRKTLLSRPQALGAGQGSCDRLRKGAEAASKRALACHRGCRPGHWPQDRMQAGGKGQPPLAKHALLQSQTCHAAVQAIHGLTCGSLSRSSYGVSTGSWRTCRRRSKSTTARDRRWARRCGSTFRRFEACFTVAMPCVAERKTGAPLVSENRPQVARRGQGGMGCG